MNSINFTISDLIAGYVTSHNQAERSFGLKTSDGREFTIHLGNDLNAEMVRNLGEDPMYVGDKLEEMLVPGRYLFAYGIIYPDDGYLFDAKHIKFLGPSESDYLFEDPDWWVNQVKQLADFYIRAEFGDGEIDYHDYRTNLGLYGQKDLGMYEPKNSRQEADTISRLVYGFATAFLMTGEDRYLEAAEKGTEYLREKMKSPVEGQSCCLWCHAVDVKDDGSEEKLFASTFSDDKDAVACYEQIYALAGPTQTYRATGDPRILDDVNATIAAFNLYFKDGSENGGIFSHIDPKSYSPHSEALEKNKSRKNWNSVGDHAPAYLINLWLATGMKEYADFLEDTFDTISSFFPDNGRYGHSPFVQEKFHQDWEPDQTWGWQQNRAIVGHNLKIAWNLMRMNSLKPKKDYVHLAKKLAYKMPSVGYDLQRGGWYDGIERVRGPGQKHHRFAWHDRKTWWQQEQAILAYLILYGNLKDPEYLKYARESAAFYNAWFLDTQAGAVYFDVYANGTPYLFGERRGKGSHSMAGYHSFELAYLAAVYTNLLIKNRPMDFYFKPRPGGFKDNMLRVSPDILPPGKIRIDGVWINGQNYSDFDASGLTVKLPEDQSEMKVKVRIAPVDKFVDREIAVNQPGGKEEMNVPVLPVG